MSVTTNGPAEQPVSTPKTDEVFSRSSSYTLIPSLLGLSRQLERELSEAVELLEAWRASAEEAKDLNFVIVAKRTDAMLVRLKGEVGVQK